MARNLVKVFIENVRRLLGERSAYWLSKKSGISQSTLSLMFSEKLNPSLETVQAIADALNVEPHVLLLKDKKAQTSTIPTDILKNLEDENPVVYDSIRSLLKALEVARQNQKRR